jgi:hypothetical protein
MSCFGFSDGNEDDDPDSAAWSSSRLRTSSG